MEVFFFSLTVLIPNSLDWSTNSSDLTVYWNFPVLLKALAPALLCFFSLTVEASVVFLEYCVFDPM